MKHDPIRTQVLSVKIIPNADPMLLKALGTREGERSLGIITTDCDDVSYAALDEATKKAVVRVVYARSMYAGSSNASTKLAGEFIGILAGPEPEEVRSGLQAMISFIENDSCFYSANDDDSICYFAHCISRTGSFLSKEADVPEGTAMAYLIAPFTARLRRRTLPAVFWSANRRRARRLAKRLPIPFVKLRTIRSVFNRVKE